MTRMRVGLVGAAGETGGSILEALIEDGGFDVVALVRPSSLSKPANTTLKKRGVELRALDLEASHESIVAALENLEVLVSAIGPRDQLAQIPLVKAAKEAGVKRLLPCGFTSPMPVGVHQSRDQKEEVYNLIKRLHIPYTIVDVGWWYQFALPPLPSGKIDYAVSVGTTSIAGDGDVPSALTDLRDVGKYVAEIIKDERTLNAMVFVHDEVWTSNQIYELLEKRSGEKIPRNYTPTEVYERVIVDADAKLNEDRKDVVARGKKVLAQYALSGIRGENTPEYARYLGYLDGKTLYPDIKPIPFESYIEEVLSGKAKGVYEDMMPMMREALKKKP